MRALKTNWDPTRPAGRNVNGAKPPSKIDRVPAGVPSVRHTWPSRAPKYAVVPSEPIWPVTSRSRRRVVPSAVPSVDHSPRSSCPRKTTRSPTRTALSGSDP